MIVLDRLRSIRDDLSLPRAAKAAARSDRRKGLGSDPDIETVVAATMDWLAHAQDYSSTQDGGVARHYSVISGWGASYPETTGYIVPTFLQEAERADAGELVARARRMLDWLVSIQLPDGAFQGGMVDQKPVVAVTFNTGQILLGLAAGSRLDPSYADSMSSAADWLVETQDESGSWSRNTSPFTTPGAKAFDTHVAWGLLEAGDASGDERYHAAAYRNVDWAIAQQAPNGWFDRCCLTLNPNPTTHTLGYTLRGILEAASRKDDQRLLDAAVRSGEGFLSALRGDGYLPGRLTPDLRGAEASACLTGTVQIAHCWLMLWEFTGDSRFRAAGLRANSYVRRTVQLDAHSGIRGGIRGSFPISGPYGRFEYLNWAAKFFIDSNRLEQRISTE